MLFCVDWEFPSCFICMLCQGCRYLEVHKNCRKGLCEMIWNIRSWAVRRVSRGIAFFFGQQIRFADICYCSLILDLNASVLWILQTSFWSCILLGAVSSLGGLKILGESELNIFWFIFLADIVASLWIPGKPDWHIYPCGGRYTNACFICVAGFDRGVICLGQPWNNSVSIYRIGICLCMCLFVMRLVFLRKKKLVDKITYVT